MQISQVKERELSVLIIGLRSVIFTDEEGRNTQAKLLKQLESELSTRYGMVVPQDA